MHITFQVAVLENESYLVNHILPLEIVEWLRIWLWTVSAGLWHFLIFYQLSGFKPSSFYFVLEYISLLGVSWFLNNVRGCSHAHSLSHRYGFRPNHNENNLIFILSKPFYQANMMILDVDIEFLRQLLTLGKSYFSHNHAFRQKIEHLSIIPT